MYDDNEEPNKPFNEAIDHFQKVEGLPISDKGCIPLPIKIIGYFIV